MNKFTRMDKLIKKKVIYISIVLFVLVMTNIALSYSYYLGKVVGNESNTTLLLTSFGLKVDYENNSDTIIADYIVPGWTTSKTFSLSTLINESDIVDLEKKLFYEIFMYVDQNDFPGELITYTLTGDSSNKIGNGEMIDNKNNIGIATGVNTEGISIGVGYFKLGSNKHDYTITFNYSDDAIFTDRKFGIHIGAKVVEHAILNLDLDGGTIEGKTTRFASKNGKVYLEKPVKIDYVFAGWEIVDGDGEVAGNEVTVNSDSVTVKAKWVVGDGSVLLFLDLNGGDTTDERYISIPSNSTVELTVPTREYYDFNGWQLITDSNATIEGNNITVQDTDVIIQAQWVFAKVKLTIDVNGGTTTQDVVSSVTMNSPATLIEPTKTGYSFAGWEITSGTAVLNGNTINISTTDVTVRAKWAIKSYTVSFNSNGGTSVSNQTVQYGSTATQPSNPTRTGYTFQGWTLNGNAFSFGTPITQNITLVASWRINTYTVTFNSNGGSSVANQTVNHGSTAKAPTNPTKSGYIFNGWTLNGSAFNFSTAITSNITLVANWKSVIPTFTYLKSDGKAASYLVVNDGGNNWRIKFLESGTLKFTYIGNASSGINVFLVGGGGAGGSGGLWHGATGGGGGYTATHSKSVQVGNTYNIVIGSGGTASSSSVGKDGGSTSAFDYSVLGGSGGSLTSTGGKGGSGGGGKSRYSTGGAGGSNGGNGGCGSGGESTCGGTGQGTTTREFGESSGALYAGGGGGGAGYSGNGDTWGDTGTGGSAGSGGGGGGGGSNTTNYNGINGTANTGGGGGGSSATGKSSIATVGGAGGSGIVIIRNAR